MTGGNSPWRWYWNLYRSHVGMLALVIAACLLQFALVLPMVFLVARIFDTTIPANDPGALLQDGAWLVAASLAAAAVTLWIRSATLKVTKQVIAGLRTQLIDRLLVLPRAVYDHADTAVLHSQVVADTERLDVMSNALVAQLIPSVLISIGLAAALAYLHVWLTLSLVLAAPLLYWVHQRMGAPLRANYLEFRRYYDRFSGGALFLLKSADLVRWQSAEDTERQRQGKNLDALRASSAHMAWYETAHGLLQNQIVTLASIAILIAGGYAVARHEMTLGALIAYYVTMGLMRTWLTAALSSAPQLVTGRRALESVLHLLNSSGAPVYSGGATLDFAGHLSLANVDFSYRGHPVLRDVSLDFAPGEIVVLAGANGAGKSTILHLLCGFYRPDRGSVLADGTPYETIDVEMLRRSFGVVPQHPALIDGSVAENIAYGRPGTTQDEIQMAASFSGVDTFASEMSQGYDTQIGEDGIRLSGGQRQRLALARALVRQPRVLILDEPTNHLDAGTVALFVANLRKLTLRPTVILISHDSKLMALADRAYRLSDGRVTAGALTGGVHG